MDTQAIRDMLKTDLLFVVLPVVLGFTFNFVALVERIDSDSLYLTLARGQIATLSAGPFGRRYD
jgi:hypothetical protein